MSLGIAFKVPEGIVLAADSRVTLFATVQNQAGQSMLLPSTFDHASKLLRVPTQKLIGAITFGAGAIGQLSPRTANSYISEFENEVGTDPVEVEAFANLLSEFFGRKWREAGMRADAPESESMSFFVGGYDTDDTPYGRLFKFAVPAAPAPVEVLSNEFGALWGGQREITDRLIQGFDPQVPIVAQDLLGIAVDDRRSTLETELKQRLTLAIPWQFLPLQDCVNLAIFLVRATITLQQFIVGVRGVGGPIDLATLTGTDGFKAVQVKEIVGELPRRL